MAKDAIYREAEKKIAKARRSGDKELDLSSRYGEKELKLTELPESLGQLTQLQSLNLSRNQLAELPEWLGQLTQLQSLGLSRNKLAELPEWLGQLTQLQNLDLADNQLAELPEWLGQLTQLQSLNLSGSQLAELPEWLGQLTQLQSLNLSGSQLAELPEWLGQLTQLRSLNLYNNRLKALPESLGQLTQLRSLDLFNSKLTELPEWLNQLTQLQDLDVSYNQLTVLPESLGQLMQLQSLDLSYNQLTTLPESLGQLSHLRLLRLERNHLKALPDSCRVPAAMGALGEVCLHDNPDLGLPDEVLGPNYVASSVKNPPKPPKEIFAYYFSTRGDSGEALRELRLIVVGRPKVGKTSLIKRLRRLPMEPDEVETHGIDILPLDLRCPDGLLLARVWDFGGQHVLHAMHEFFLRSRCLYLLVVEQRVNDVERDLTYWLQLIRSYAGDAPVVVALNQSKGIARPLARAALERDYGPILAWIPTDCEMEQKVPGADATIEALREALSTAAAAMPEPKKLFPRKWLEIKRWLESMKEPFLDYSAYAKRCAELHEDDPRQQEALAAAMDELGVALNYARDPRLRDTTVLRPNWLANGIYALLRANILAEEPLAPDGVLTKLKVGEILAIAEKAEVLKVAEYPQEKWSFLLRLMNLFQLSFPLDGLGERNLVPTLLPADEPADSGEPEGPNRAQLRYVFDVLPGPLVGRLLVRLFAVIDGRKAWQRGARLRYGKAQARVWADLNEIYLYVTVAGDARDRDELLEMIRETLKDLFREYERLRVVEQWRHRTDWSPRSVLEELGVLIREEDYAVNKLDEKEARSEG